MSHQNTVIATLLIAATLVPLSGCEKKTQQADDPRAPAVDQRVREKWHKPLSQLPTLKLVAISPHHDSIKNEFAAAFSLDHAEQFGQNVDIEWRDVGGGSTAILQYLRNVYARADSAQIDIVWGGGDVNFTHLAQEDLLHPLQLPQDILDNIPLDFGGLPMRDPQNQWVGTAISGFGFLYNKSLLQQLNITPPALWDDLASPKFQDLIALADPTQSGSAAVVYEMIVQSEPDWPDGWAKLLAILGNAKKFFDSASGAAKAPALGEAPVATCIDFYGLTRVAEAPEDLVYISPIGQTAFTPDPIAILKNPPNPELAQRFVNFVLSRRGQALWALQVGKPDGPIRNALGRLPIRPDVYQHYRPDLLPWIADPFQAGQALQVDMLMRQVRSAVLTQLVRAAAVENHQALRAARQTILKSNNPQQTALFNALPPNVRTRDQITQRALDLDDPVKAERITTDWINFFNNKYHQITSP